MSANLQRENVSVDLLDTLLRIFAAVAKKNGVTDQDFAVVRNFLSHQFNDRVAHEFILRFRQFVENDEESGDLIALLSRLSSNLRQPQKYYILTRLIELAYSDRSLTSFELNAIGSAARIFRIDQSDFRQLLKFITCSDPRNRLLPDMTIIASEPRNPTEKIYKLDHLEGHIAMLSLRNVGLHLIRYIGGGDIYLNGQIMNPEAVYTLSPGSVIKSGKTRPLFYSDLVRLSKNEEHADPIILEALGVEYKFPSGVYGLHELDLRETSGRMVAIMGPSGAGKTTLSKILIGTLRPTKGFVTINNVDVHRYKDEVRGLMGYVSQDDTLIEELTVYENLYFAAKLCFGHLSDYQIKRRVLKTLSELGLSDIKRLKVGSPLNPAISGGQRKRLNIALELIREPAILMVDEPTSGLSSRDSESVMDLLKMLAGRGKLVLVVIHQPSSDIFKMFDRFLLLDKGGYPVYYGDPLEGIRYFRRAFNHVNPESVECSECGTVNPDQMFSILEEKVIDEFGRITQKRRMQPYEWFYAFRNSRIPEPRPEKEYDLPKPGLHIPGKLRQWLTYAHRDLKIKLSNKPYLILSMSVGWVLAWLLAFILKSNGSLDESKPYTLYDNDNLPAFFFVSVIVALFLGLIFSAIEIVRDRLIRRRESYIGLSRHAYLAAKISVLFAISAVQMAGYVLTSDYVLEMRELGWSRWTALFSMACFGNLLGLNVSATFDKPVNIYILVPILIIPQMVLCGAIVPFDKMNPVVGGKDPVPWVGEITATRWAYEAIAVRQFTRNSYQKNFYPFDKELAEADYRLDYWLPELESRTQRAAAYIAERVKAEASGQAFAFNVKKAVQYERDLQLIRTELRSMPIKLGFRDRRLVDKLQPDHFNAAVARDLSSLYERIRKHYATLRQKAQSARDLAAARLSRSISPVELQKRYDNRALAAMLTHYIYSEHIGEVDGRLVPLSDPDYRIPPPKPGLFGFRTWLYAPVKYVYGYYVDTFVFNIVVLWLFVAALYWTLYVEFFRNLIQRITNYRNAFLIALRERRKSAEAAPVTFFKLETEDLK
ncbi:MAG: ATP-binding cassette domain-containing protein [Bacteroidia bacterium]|nr:ATP-binding cassette domain-containing protein [Bacteroidia bacterium]MDW8332724.1 ATP-binding cassette domain-containing protein [Bacteroidia bacterium]